RTATYRWGGAQHAVVGPSSVRSVTASAGDVRRTGPARRVDDLGLLGTSNTMPSSSGPPVATFTSSSVGTESTGQRPDGQTPNRFLSDRSQAESDRACGQRDAP